MTPNLPAGYSVVEDTEQTLPAPQASSAPALPKGYSLVDEPKEQSIANFAKGLATEVAVGGAGQVVGAMTGPGYFVIAPASGAYGNYLKQQQEIERGERNQLSVGEMVASALINTIPGGVATKVGAKVLKAPTAAIGRTVGERTARIGEQAVIRGTEGAVIGAGAKTVETAIEDKRWPTYDEYLNVIKSGAAFGGAVGVGEKVLAPTLSKTASKIWNRFSGKTQQEVSQELTTIRNTGNPEERQAAGEIIDEVGQRMGLVNPRPKSAQESATQFATAVEPRATGAAEESARALLGNEAVETAKKQAAIPAEVPIPAAQKSAAVFEQAFTEGQTQAGSQGLRARLAAEQQAAEADKKLRSQFGLQGAVGGAAVLDEANADPDESDMRRNLRRVALGMAVPALASKALSKRGAVVPKRPEMLWETVSQELPSANTSINQYQLPATFSKVEFKQGTINADIGGGRFNNATEYLKKNGVENVIFDPFNRPHAENVAAINRISNGKADTATVNNVLNVIKEPENRLKVIAQAANAIKPDGTAYFLIYEGNNSGFGRATKAGSWQENRKPSSYIDEIKTHFDEFYKRGNLIEARKPKRLEITAEQQAGKIGRSMKTDMPTTEDIIQEFQNVPGVKGRAGALKMGLVGSAAAASTVAAESMGDKGDATVKAPVDSYEIVHPDSRIGTLKYDATKWNEDSILQDINKKEMELVKIDVASPSLIIREKWQQVQDARDRGEITELEAQKKQFDLMRDTPIKEMGFAMAAEIGFPLLGEALTAKTRVRGLGRVPGAMIGEAVGSMIEGRPVTAGGVLGAGISASPGGVKGQFAKNLMRFAGAKIGGEITKEAIDQGDFISYNRAAMAAAEGGAGAATMKLMDKAARAVSSQVAKRGNWAAIKTLSGANELGLIVDPTIYSDSWPQSMVMKLAGGSTKFQDAASRINYPRMTEAVEGVLGVPAGTSFDRPFFLTMRMELGKSYEKIAAVSKQARSAVDDWKAANEAISVNSKAAASETTPKVRIQYREAAAKAREDADKAFAVIQTEAYATGKGNLVDDLIESRKQLGRMYAIKASVNEASGKIEYPGVWGEMYQAGTRFDGNLEKLARISAIMPEVLQPPQNMIRQRPLKGAAETKMMQNMMSLPFRAGLAGPQAAALQTMMSRPYQSGAIGDMMSFRTQPGVPDQLGRFLGTEGAEAARPIPYR